MRKYADPKLVKGDLYTLKEFLFFDNVVSTALKCSEDKVAFYENMTERPEHYLCFLRRWRRNTSSLR